MYEEALERAKTYNKDNALINPKDVIPNIFPELQETEEKRIKEELIKYFEAIKLCYNQDTFHGFKIDNIIAWLKKQKTDIVYNENSTEENIDKGEDINIDECCADDIINAIEESYDKEDAVELINWFKEHINY